MPTFTTLFSVLPGKADRKIRSTDILQHYGAISDQLSFDKLEPYLRQAETAFIEPYIGTDFLQGYRDLQQDDLSAEPKKAQILRLMRDAAIHYGIYMYIPAHNVDLTELGVQEREDEKGTSRPAARWRTTKLLWDVVKKGDLFLSVLMAYLLDLAESDSSGDNDLVTAWTDHSSYAQRGSLLFNRGSQVAAITPWSHDEVSFQLLTPYLQDVERTKLEPNLGSDFLEEISTWAKAADFEGLSESKKKVVKLARRATAGMAIAQANLSVQLYRTQRGYGIISDRSFDDGQRSVFDADQLATMRAFSADQQSRGEKALGDLMYLLYKKDPENADYSTFADWTGKRIDPEFGPKVVGGRRGGMGIFK